MDSNDDMEYSFTLTELMKRNCSSENELEVVSNGAIENKDDWFQDRETYERNFNHLQEQLLAVMVEKQQLLEESKKFDKQSITELEEILEEEKAKRMTAESRVKILMSKRRRKNSESSCASADRDIEDLSSELDDSKHEEADRISGAKPRFRGKLMEYKIYFWNIFHERISDFINDADVLLEEVDEEELSVRRLKENVNRFTEALQPIKRCVSAFHNLFSWKNPWITFSIFAIYTYSLYHEMAIPLLLALMLVQLSWNYVRVRGIGKRILGEKKEASVGEAKEDQNSVSLTERYQLVLLIAKKVQNNVGYIADSMEKCQNLLLWQHERASKLLFQCILAALAMSIILPTNRFFMLVGLLTGIKLFIITPIYTSFPKVQKRYDEFQTLWEELPTHKENMRRKIQQTIEIYDEIDASSFETMNSTVPSTSPSIPNNSNISDQQLEGVSHDTIVFCDRFQLPITEAPNYDWQEGRRCTMMDKESPLSSMKHGRMYLTPSYICFERNQFHSKKNIAINLNDIVYVKKAKPISFMPGQGMAIEIQVKDLSKPYLFGAMISRDEAFDSIIKMGRLLNLSWSCNNV